MQTAALSYSLLAVQFYKQENHTLPEIVISLLRNNCMILPVIGDFNLQSANHTLFHACVHV